MTRNEIGRQEKERGEGRITEQILRAKHLLSVGKFTLFPCPLLPCGPVVLACAALSRRLSRALRLLDTFTFALPSLPLSTLELPSSRPHLLAGRGPRADTTATVVVAAGCCWCDVGDGDAEGDGTDVIVLESSVSVSLAGS